MPSRDPRQRSATTTAASTGAQVDSRTPPGRPHVSYDLASEADTAASRLSPPVIPQHSRSDTEVPPLSRNVRPQRSHSAASANQPGIGASGMKRRGSRAPTFRTFDGGEDEFEMPFSGTAEGWHPGAEPGYDPQLPDGGHASVPQLSAACEITVVDFALDHMQQWHFANDAFIEFLAKPKEDWAKCRWININGLSWDVIQAVGSTKGLHKLAIEDIMNLRNRTKVDWYPNHAFIIMTLQKLVHIVDSDTSSISSASSSSSRKTMATVRQFFSGDGGRNNNADPEKTHGKDAAPPFVDLPETNMLRSLQRYQASGNEARTLFMEAHSSLAPYNLAISAEQVSIFLTADNTVISFFEASASDVEHPIVKRLSTPGTSLRDSCDASLLVQGIIDAIIDLAIPLTAVYTDILGDLELDVISSPSIKQSKRLYICISEINKMLRFLLPIDNLVNVLRDHRTLMTQEQAARELTNPSTGVLVTPMTHTYLGDVLDHCIIITESLQQLKQSSENLINLIFNTITANQNESMKQLTTVTIIFLPLTFITGFFGQNFQDFPEIKKGIWYFWACAVPTVVATIMILMRDMIYNWGVSVVQRKRITSIRKKRRRRRATFSK
ncbi:Mg2+ transporter protein, CorA-like/Zinc transport protein ZntB [Cordyceps fumosorosea ARSEF 2679]|uniref:Mg2+ transporter protein, CorA-like/Zinc transport protein ZntB n=1 Tax=Cordyceps fumosorosea (strain ARSEF 2679) TaxID=1081104 RepID=A0A168ETW3_CORFA|nr:Mg2+ transporter protein, CorA-like/Zinc transport protein ZntB [Cordyceps fumosorosea ARSEF 2679]OAA74216.1 Mg2+ transporter protein, CorA-like/Zinc transport protein ZntB [Cordyceps fumosorosea ARSEF 2679]